MERPLLALVAAAALVSCGWGTNGDDAQPPEADAEGGGTAMDSTTTASTSATTSGAETDQATASTASDPSTGSQPPEADPCAPGDRPAIEVGHGEVVFEAFDAHPAELVYGVQGGYHIIVGVRGVHTDNTDVSVLRMTAVIDGQELAFSAPYVELRCIDDLQEANNLLLVFDATPEALHGKTALITAELTDAAGDVHVAEGEVVIHDPTMD